MGLIYVIWSILTQSRKKLTSSSKRYPGDDGTRKQTQDVFSRRIRFWGMMKMRRRKRKGKKEVAIVVEAIGEQKSNINASVEADDRVDDRLSNAFSISDVRENIQDDPKSAEQVPFSNDEKYTSDKEIDHTSLNVDTIVGYLEPVAVQSPSDLHQSLIEQLPEFRDCKMSHLNNGFFAFKFPTEDQEILVLEHDQLFINNKPLILKRWSPSIDLVPRNFLSAIPIWVRYYNLNWVYWNQVCLSKISSIIGVPLFMDKCTATMTRLEYARVCIQVNTNELRMPDTVHMLRDGKIIPVPVDYEWKPGQCQICLSIYHDSGTCTVDGGRELSAETLHCEICLSYHDSDTCMVDGGREFSAEGLQCEICLSIYHDSDSCTFVGVVELSVEGLQLQPANATLGNPLRSSYDEDGVDTISVSSGPQCEESSIEGNLDDALQERKLFLSQNP